ncbi:YabP/YqfC family sporulation protein [Oscillospiraceae bacterium PP1C4]
MWKKRRAHEDQTSIANKLVRSFELPVNIMERMPEIELLGNKEAVIEHCQGVLEYNEHVVRLNTGRMTLKFLGRNLQMKCMTDDSVIVEGYFTSIEFLL